MEGLEAGRRCLANAMKRGLTLVVSLQQGSPPFSDWLDDDDFFPAKEVTKQNYTGVVLSGQT